MATLNDILQARDARQREQQRLLRRWGCTLVCFTMNIAGAEKRSALIDYVFDRGRDSLLHQLPALFSQTIRRPAGNEFYLVSPLPAPDVKRICLSLEDSAVGRLYDMDVLTPEGDKLSRAEPRRCLLCERPAFLCAHDAKHGQSAVIEETQRRLRAFAADALAASAVQALRDEVCLTPKPGLVDAGNSGAHSDMSLPLFLASAEALRPYFHFCAATAMETPDCMRLLQEAGKEAERVMLRVTGGINTHKGSIYSLGLLTAAAGAVLCHGRSLYEQAAAYARAGAKPDATSNGSLALSRYSGRGARQEAEEGYPLAQKAVRLLRLGFPPEELVLYLILECQDTNVLHRGGMDGLRFARCWAKRVLSAEPARRPALLADMDRAMIARNLSPGGCADLLATAFFLRHLPFA